MPPQTFGLTLPLLVTMALLPAVTQGGGLPGRPSLPDVYTQAPAPAEPEALPVAAPCLEWEQPIEMTGVLVRRYYPGPPDYEEGRNMQPYLVLKLPAPICFQPSDDPDWPLPAELGVTEIQMTTVPGKLGEIVTVRGHTFAPETGHHYTRALIDVQPDGWNARLPSVVATVPPATEPLALPFPDRAAAAAFVRKRLQSPPMCEEEETNCAVQNGGNSLHLSVSPDLDRLELECALTLNSVGIAEYRLGCLNLAGSIGVSSGDVADCVRTGGSSGMAGPLVRECRFFVGGGSGYLTLSVHR